MYRSIQILPEILIAIAVLAGCAHRAARSSSGMVIPPPPATAPQSPVIPAAPSSNNLVAGPDFLDLEAGWRLRVTTPLVKPHEYRIEATEGGTSNGTVTLSAGGQSVAYETAIYTIEGRASGEMGFDLLSAKLTKDGQDFTEPAPQGWRPVFPWTPKFVRLIYLRRLSEHDHNMAVVAALDNTALEAVTRRVQTSPGDGCTGDDLAFCTWVPPKTAVVAERRNNGAEASWVPVR